jgi:hypothetical protein
LGCGCYRAGEVRRSGEEERRGRGEAPGLGGAEHGHAMLQWKACLWHIILLVTLEANRYIYIYLYIFIANWISY